MSELLARALKIAENAEALARELKHSEAVTIEAEYTEISLGEDQPRTIQSTNGV
jgi:hypothetical protein